MSYIADLGHVWLPNLVYSWFTKTAAVWTDLPVLSHRRQGCDSTLLMEDVKHTPTCLCCFPTLEARVFLEARVVYHTHPSGVEPKAKSQDLMRLPCVTVKVGKLDFFSSSPWLGASWLLHETWNASAHGGRQRCATMFPTRVSPLPVGTAETLCCPFPFV